MINEDVFALGSTGNADEIKRRDQEIMRLQGIIRSQEEALKHWRREADRDYGRIMRMSNALKQISDSDPSILACTLREHAKRELSEA